MLVYVKSTKPPITAMTPPIGTLTRPTPLDGRTLAAAFETPEIEGAAEDTTDIDAEAAAAEDAAEDAAADVAELAAVLDPELAETACPEPPTAIDCTVSFPVAAFRYHGLPQASAIFLSSQPLVRAGWIALNASI